jgi:hypothetical protein
MRNLCYAETIPALVMEPPQHSWYEGTRTTNKYVSVWSRRSFNRSEPGLLF